MQYKKLKAVLNKMTDSDLDKDITLQFGDELWAVEGIRAADYDLGDIVDEGTLIIVAKTKG